MSIGLNDLQPSSVKLTIKGVELTSKPLRLKHALVLAKVGNIFENASTVKTEEIEQAQKDIDTIFTELIPELKDIELDISATTELLQKLMETITPEDNRELNEAKVQLNTDPKVQVTG